MRENITKKIVVVGGGTAGWLVASILASRFTTNQNQLDLTVIESDVIPTLGVGEGTWPSMRGTLKNIGLSEVEFINSCNVSFKQGSKFVNWKNGKDTYYHPFQLPMHKDINEVIKRMDINFKSFADLVCPQIALDINSKAPKLITTEDYASVVNYGYHLDAGKFGQILRDCAMEKHGVKQIIDTIIQIQSDDNGYIKSVSTEKGETIAADFFVDCSGFTSILMRQHYKIPYESCSQYLFNDCAIASQIPYSEEGAAINSYTLSTAQAAGWIWDIGLSSRRGVGYTYSSAHISDDMALSGLKEYLKSITNEKQIDKTNYKKIKFESGHLKKFWHKNCVAIGVAAGFLEPLEASAIAMIELAAKMLAENFPFDYDAMNIAERRFNERFVQHWEHIIEFLKLHYVLSVRDDSPYWIENRNSMSIPQKLQEKMKAWQYYSPSAYDDVGLQELFPVASYQYILYGMGYRPMCTQSVVLDKKAIQALNENFSIAQQIERNMPTNRSLLDTFKNLATQY